ALPNGELIAGETAPELTIRCIVCPAKMWHE
ncbi:MAG: hypothetical protein ACI9G1_003278, partial [Pirellulaceae bacterium]